MAKNRKPRASRRSSLPVGEAGIEPEPNAIPIEPGFWSGAGTPAWKRPEVFHSLEVLIAAFEEVEGYDPQRHHNQPPPALWLSNSAYQADVKDLLEELRELNSLLRELAGKDKDLPKPVVRKVDAALAVLATAGKKFVESYADLLGKGAAALTIGALAGFVASAGLSKELVDAIWAHFKPK